MLVFGEKPRCMVCNSDKVVVKGRLYYYCKSHIPKIQKTVVHTSGKSNRPYGGYEKDWDEE